MLVPVLALGYPSRERYLLCFLNRGAEYIHISVVSSADFRYSFRSSPMLTYLMSTFLFSRFRARPFDRHSLCTCICIPYVLTSCV
jgi:hypothetical protein